MFRTLGVLLTFAAAAASPPATRPATTAPSQPAQLVVTRTSEEGKEMLVATVTVGGKPVEDVPVVFQAQRAFGQMSIGSEKTLDDGTAAVPFPANLTAGQDGSIHIIALTSPDAKYVARGDAQYPATGAGEEPFPRALWGPHAPVGLIVTVFGVFGLAWASFGYVAFQLLKIKKGDRK